MIQINWGKWETWEPDSAWLESIVATHPKLVTASNTLNTLADKVIDAARVVDLVSGFIAADPIHQAMAALGGVFSSFINGLEATDIYALPLLPKTWGDLLHPYTYQNVLIDLESSLSDMLDPNRPTAGPGEAYVSLTILVGANNWMDFRRLIKLLGGLFSQEQADKWSRFADIRFNFDKYDRHPIPRPDRNSQGETWDWYRSNWLEWFPVVGHVVTMLRDTADALMGGITGLGEGLQDLAEVIAERASYLSAIAEELANVAKFLANIRQLAPSSRYIMTKGAQGGVTQYINDVVNASDAPEYKLTAGITFFASVPNPDAYVEILKRIFGFQLEAVRQVGLQAQEQFQNP